jgi:hypothetical protein
MPQPTLTDARRRGLAVLLAGEEADRPVYHSNFTSDPDATRLTIYWQTVDWLTRSGYATLTQVRTTAGYHERRVNPTPQGIALARSAMPSAASPVRNGPASELPATSAAAVTANVNEEADDGQGVGARPMLW